MRLHLTNNGVNINLANEPYSTQGLRLSLIANTGGGKSWAMAVLAEEAHAQHIPFIFFDVSGDAASLRELGDDVMLVGRPDHPDPIRRAHRALDDAKDNPRLYINLALEEGYSLVFDLSGRSEAEQCCIFSTLGMAYYRLTETLRDPILMLIDEAHKFAPQRSPRIGQRDSLATFFLLVNEGRKHGALLAFSTQRAAFINKDTLHGCNFRAFGLCNHPPDFKQIKEFLPPPAKDFRRISILKSGQFYLISPNNWSPEPITIKARRTTHLGSTPVVRTRNKSDRPSVKALQIALPMEVEEMI